MISQLVLSTVLKSRQVILGWQSTRPVKPGHRYLQDTLPLHPLFHVAFIICVGSWVLYLLPAGLRKAFPLLTGMDRFRYRRFHADIITLDLLDLKFVPAFALCKAITVARNRVLRNLYLTIFLGLMAVSFLFGDKFFTILLCVTGFLTAPAIADLDHVVKAVLRLVPAFLVTAVFMLAVTCDLL